MTSHPNRSDIYAQHDAAFAHVAAFVITEGGEQVAKIAFKFPRDGAGRLYCYAQFFGYPMVRGWAPGYGYDKKSAAASVAARKMRGQRDGNTLGEKDGKGMMFAEPGSKADRFMAALGQDDGMGWDRRLRDAGFEVWQAV